MNKAAGCAVLVECSGNECAACLVLYEGIRKASRVLVQVCARAVYAVRLAKLDSIDHC